MSCWSQFRLLVWKNYLLQKRRPVATVFELLLPVTFSILLVIIRTNVIVTNYPNITTWKEFKVDHMPGFDLGVLPPSGEWTVAYVPGNMSVVAEIMEAAKQHLNANIRKSPLERKCNFDFKAFNDRQTRDTFEFPRSQGGPPDALNFAQGFNPRNSSSDGNSANLQTIMTQYLPSSGSNAVTQNSAFATTAGSFPRTSSLSMVNMLAMENNLQLAAAATYGQLPVPMQDILNEMAAQQNTSSIALLLQALQNKNLDEFIQALAQKQLESTLKCIARELGGIDSMNQSNSDLPDFSSNNVSSEMMEYLSFIIKVVPKVNIKPFESEEMFLTYVKNDANLKNTLAGVIFTGVSTDSDDIPDNLKLTFRFHADPISRSAGSRRAFTGVSDSWETNRLFPNFQVPGPRENNATTGGKPFYFDEGFLALLHAVHIGIASVLSNTSSEQYLLGLKRYPYPPFIDDNFIIAIRNTLPLMIMLSFFYTALIIVRSVVQEKESRMKEYMMMMGLSNWLHWLAWFIKYIVFLCISCILMVIFYKIKTPQGSILTYSDGIVVFVFLIIFSAATINLSFLMSVFFKKANVAAAAGGVLYALTYMPYLFMSNNFNDLSLPVKLVASLLSNVAMASGFNLVSMFEGKGTGVQWYNLHKGVTVDDSFTMLHVFGMLILDAVIYMLLAVYIEGVWPGEYGVPKPWNFPFMKSYWMGRNTVNAKYSVVDNVGGIDNPGYEHDIDVDKDFFEENPTGLKRTVEIKGLRKVFKNRGKLNVAVDCLRLNMFDGQITVLLGHNGAGKTTTMSMLTGFFPPSAGDAFVDGHSVTKDIAGVRKAMGLCPQFNILFDLLTVDEHLCFFGKLKGLNNDEALQECKNMKEILKLTDKASAKSSTLSGGMKRKLSVGIALCAGSKYVILDEPTSGMDPAARRAIWDVLQTYRNRCSMLLSTHFMDEADLLGDRIAIMAKGKLRCVGSSVFLKNKFGVGYHIILTKQPDCDVAKLTDLIQSFIPETNLERTAGAELSFVLPFHASPHFPELFRALDDQASSLGISGYGAVVTTMEEVFLRVTEDATEAVRTVSNNMFVNKSAILNSDVEATLEEDALQPLNEQKDHLHTSYHLNKGPTLWFQQFYSLVVKRILHSGRNYKVALAQLVVPVFFAVLALINAKYPPWERPNVPFDLTLDAYEANTVYVENANSSAFGEVYDKQFLGTKETSILNNGDLEQFLSDKFQKEGGEFNSRNLVSGSFQTNGSRTHAIAWFNNQAFHTPATSLAYMDQAYLRNITNRNFKMKYINYPLPRNSTNRVEEQLLGSLSGFLISMNLVLGFSFLAASFCIFLVRERVDRSALLQTLTGVDPFCFWISAFVWDFVNFIIPCLLTMVMFLAFSVTEFTNHSAIAFLLFALYCWAAIPLTYLLSFFFTVPSTALVRVTIANVIFGLASIITVNILRLLSYDDAVKILNWIFLFLPPYCLGMGLSDLYANDKMVNICTTNDLYKNICKSLDIQYQEDFMAWEQYGVGKFAVFLAIQGFAFFVILFCIENDVHQLFLRISLPVKRSLVQAAHEEAVFEDDDVKDEAEKINGSELPLLTASNQLLLKNLRKMYGFGSKKLLAVQNLCIGVTEGECFGLLGINGAGKTTTFRMLTGDLTPTSGTAYINGYDITTHLKKAQQRVGYCPQFDALIDQMTGRETIRMYARLRGVPESDIPACIQNLGKILHFSEHLDKQCGKYSGGNKRKLSTAIALVGNPPIVLLDEPSTGMDPGARRMLWEALTTVRTSGRSIVISSHSMEECEALCTRLAIMVNGSLRCIGGPQHLKNKFGQGYTVEIKAPSGTLTIFMEKNIPGSTLKDEHQGVCTYHVPQYKADFTEIKLATVFEIMEKAKNELGFGEYTVTQTTLEQVFLRLVRWQREANANSSAA